MNVNFGLFPPIEAPKARGKEKGRLRKQALSERALGALSEWLDA
jgi:methylenetetrahydrofolate--tRNA-(uracil-5-)-methyltransferase